MSWSNSLPNIAIAGAIVVGVYFLGKKFGLFNGAGAGLNLGGDSSLAPEQIMESATEIEAFKELDPNIQRASVEVSVGKEMQKTGVTEPYADIVKYTAPFMPTIALGSWLLGKAEAESEGKQLQYSAYRKISEIDTDPRNEIVRADPPVEPEAWREYSKTRYAGR